MRQWRKEAEALQGGCEAGTRGIAAHAKCQPDVGISS